MTATSIANAMREIEALFRAAWVDDQDEQLPCDYPNSDFELPTGRSAVWARYRIQHAAGGQVSLANHNGNRRFDRTGTIFVQVFVPVRTGVITAYNWVEKVVNAYEGKRTASDVWFRDVRINEVPDEENAESEMWLQTNVLIDFVYEQVK